METLRLSPPEMPGKKRPPMTVWVTWVRLSSAMTADTCAGARAHTSVIVVQIFSLDTNMLSYPFSFSFFFFTVPAGMTQEETPRPHLLPDGFSRVLLQGQLGRVGQRLLHRQITQQIITLEHKTGHPGEPKCTALLTPEPR